MLKITIPEEEFYDESSQTFVYAKQETLQLEHSLVSISKWEAKWNKPFLSKEEKTYEETIDYVRCMTITQNVNRSVYTRLTNENLREIDAYIEAPMTATTIHEDKTKTPGREIITSELIYYWMIALNIPPEYQKWHLNRLLTLVRVCNVKNTPPKKRSKKEIMSRNAALNAKRRRALNSRG